MDACLLGQGNQLMLWVGFVVKALFHHDMIHFLEIDFAFRAVLASILACARDQIPAGNGEIEDRGTLFPHFFTAPADIPTGSDGQELLDAGNVEALVRQQFAETFEPLKIVIGIKPLPSSSGGLDQALLFVDPKRSWMNTQQFSNNADGIKRLLVLHFHTESSCRIIAQSHLKSCGL
jgi:hypothetical protein